MHRLWETETLQCVSQRQDLVLQPPLENARGLCVDCGLSMFVTGLLCAFDQSILARQRRILPATLPSDYGLHEAAGHGFRGYQAGLTARRSWQRFQHSQKKRERNLLAVFSPIEQEHHFQQLNVARLARPQE